MFCLQKQKNGLCNLKNWLKICSERDIETLYKGKKHFQSPNTAQMTIKFQKQTILTKMYDNQL